MSLTGKFFHSYHPQGNVQWQGVIEEELPGGFYRVQLFDWVVGADSCQRIVPIAAMTRWSLYDTSQEMNEAYSRRPESRPDYQRKPSGRKP